VTALTTTELIALVFVTVLAIIIAGLLLFLLRRLRDRKAKLLGDLSDRPQLNQDRAFNRLAMARREVTILAGQGVDVRRAQELIAESQGEFDLHQYEKAYQSAQSAHEALVNARQQGSMTSGVPLGAKPEPSTPLPTHAGPTAAAPETAPYPPPPTPALPKNRAESRFQIELLEEELSRLPSRRAKSSPAAEADALRSQATAAFDRGDFTEAFRLALSGRRALGASVESLPLSGTAPAGAPRPVPNGSAATDATKDAEAVASGERCPDCGFPALAGDAFCRGCGRPRSATSCSSCGAPRVGDEPFCGRCGSRFA